jgi:hypothetical protein
MEPDLESNESSQGLGLAGAPARLDRHPSLCPRPSCSSRDRPWGDVRVHLHSAGQQQMPHHAMDIRERSPLASIQFIHTRINRNEAELSGISDGDADKPSADVDNMRLKHPGLLDRAWQLLPRGNCRPKHHTGAALTSGGMRCGLFVQTSAARGGREIAQRLHHITVPVRAVLAAAAVHPGGARIRFEGCISKLKN